MIRRALWLLVESLAGIVAGLTLAAAFLVWRLSSGPVSLDYLAPHVAGAIAKAESGVAVHIDHTLLSLGEGATIEIVPRGVRIGRRDGKAQLMLPELVLGLSLRAALSGVAAPTRIVLREPELRLERAEDGTFHVGVGAETPEAGDWAEALLHDLAAAPDRRGPLGYLTQVAVRNAALTLADRALGVTWRAKRAVATLFRGADSVFGDVAVTVEAPGGSQAELRGDFRYAYGAGRLGIQLGFGDLSPARFAEAAPALAPLAALQLPFSGQVRVELDAAALRIGDAWCDLSLGAGRFAHPALPGGGVAIASGQLRAAYDPAKGRVKLERLRLDLGGPRLALAGTVDGPGGDVLAGGWPTAIELAGELHLEDIPADALAGLWPEKLSPHSRSWVTEHIHDGIVTEGTARVGAHVDLAADAARPVRVDSFAGTLAYRNLTIEYFKPLAPLRGVDGTAEFDRTRLDLVPSSGSVKGVELTGGAAKLSKLDTDDEEIAIELGLKGPLRDVLEVLDSKPLEYARALKIDPARVAGQVDGQLDFAFPLKHDLTLDLVDIGARARLSGVAIQQVLIGHDLSAGELQLRLDRNALRLDGTGRISEVPATLSWTESLKPKDPTPSRYTLKARLDEAARRKLGLDLPAAMLTGPIDLDVAYTSLPAKRGRASVSVDLTATALDLAQLGWKKAADAPANAALDLDLADDRVRAIREATLKGARLDLRLAAALDDAGGITRVEVPRLIAGETDVSGAVSRGGDGGWRVELKGLSFDATALMSDLDRTAKSNRTDPPLVIDAALDRLILGPKREARNVKGQLYSDGIHWQAMSIDAGLLGNGKASLRFGQAAGDRSFRLTTDDLGALLRLFDVSDNVQGGHIEVNGQVEDSGRRRVFRGRAEGADYRVVRAPVFARLLSVASLSGIAALLSGEGIPFTRLKGEFVIADGKLEGKELRAYGGAIGIKADGVYDFGAETLDFTGTLVPAYTINSVLGNIPLLGRILVGSEGEGMFAANFRVAGPVADARITVNPLSVVAPGVLRKLFLFDAPEPSQAPPKSLNDEAR